MTTVKELLALGRSVLEENDIPSASLDANLLLAHAWQTTREKLLARYPDPVPAEVRKTFLADIDRRSSGYPVAYILGVKGFRQLDFLVDERVLIPRPDTEVLVEAALDLLPKCGPNPKILDLCCGSGCVGISLAHEYPQADVVFGDLSRDALDVTRANAQRLLGRDVYCFETDLLSNVPSGLDLIVTNPPYLTPQETKDCLAQGWKEPAMALDGQGDEGLDLIRRIIIQSKKRLKKGGYLLIEASPLQMPAMAAELEKNKWRTLGTREDLAGLDRVLIAQFVK